MKNNRWKLIKIKFKKEFEDLILGEIADFEFNGIENVDAGKYVIFKIFFPDNFDGKLFRNRLKKYDAEFLGERIIFQENWDEKWRKNFKGVECGVFFIRPPWMEKKSEKIDVVIEPGGAFGTGLHETTQLCLERIPHLFKSGYSILDAGCGSGILMISTIRFADGNGVKVGKVVGVDIEEESIKESFKNLSLNKISENRVELFNSNLKKFNFPQKFDLIFANMLYNEIEMNIEKMKSLLKEGGVLLFSGILSSEKEDFLQLLKRNDFSVRGVFEKNKWLLFEVKVVR